MVVLLSIAHTFRWGDRILKNPALAEFFSPVNIFRQRLNPKIVFFFPLSKNHYFF